MEKIIIEKKDAFSTEIQLIKDEEINSNFGVTVMLDSLGTNNLTLSESKEFIKSLDFIVKFTNQTLGKLFSIYGTDLSNNGTNIFSEPKIISFQDTIIISFLFDDNKKLNQMINYIGEYLAHIMVASLNHKIYFRGAISIGKYIEYGNRFLLGEAVYDAASWYEEADWLGIIFTPNSGKYITLINQKINEGIIEDNVINKEKFNWLFSEMIVPLKTKREKLWVVNWPLALSTHASIPELHIEPKLSALGYYFSLINMAKIPKGAETKYNNTNTYVEQFFIKYPRFNNILRPDKANYPEFDESIQ